MASSNLDDVDVHLRAIISSLYILIAQAHDYQGTGTQQAIAAEIKRLIGELLSLSQAARRLPTHIPDELITYVEDGRNPDVYTREFVELVMRYNQKQKGQSEAFVGFRDILARQMIAGIPEIREDVKMVVEASGGHIE